MHSPIRFDYDKSRVYIGYASPNGDGFAHTNGRGWAPSQNFTKASSATSSVTPNDQQE